jgi:hypothetical protein
VRGLPVNSEGPSGAFARESAEHFSARHQEMHSISCESRRLGQSKEPGLIHGLLFVCVSVKNETRPAVSNYTGAHG